MVKRSFDCACWNVLEFDLDTLLSIWDVMMGGTDSAHRSNPMIMASGYLTDTATRLDMYWGDFTLVDANGNEIPLTALA